MSDFIHGCPLILEGLLDSSLAELTAEQPISYGFADRSALNLSNTLDSSSAVIPEIVGISGERSEFHEPTRPLTPPQSHQPSALTTSLNADDLLGRADASGRQLEDVAFDITSGLSVSKTVARSRKEAAVESAYENSRQSVPHLSPMPIQAQAINGEILIQAEDYRKGRTRQTYFDTTPGNQGGEYRNDAVDIHRTTDSGGGYHVGWVRPSEWLTYDLALDSGTYDVVFRASSKWQGGRLKLSAGSSTGELKIGKTKDWQKFQDFTLKGFQVDSSQSKFRLDVLSGAFNLNHIKFVPSLSKAPPAGTHNHSGASGERFIVQAEDYNGYFDTTRQNSGRAYRNDGVDIQKIKGSKGNYAVVENRPGEWLNYNFSPKAGTYDVVVRASSKRSGGRIQLSFGDNQTNLKIGRTKWWGRYKNFVAKGVKIGPNIDTFRLDILSGSMHLDFIEFIPRTTNSGSSPTSGGNGSVQEGGSGNGGNQGGGSTPGMGPLPNISFNSTYGYGLVDAASAVSYATDTTIYASTSTNSGSNSSSLNAMNVPDVWNAGFTGKGQVVAILDTGVDIRHRDLAKNTWNNAGEVAGDGIDNDGNGYVDDVNGYNFVNSSANVLDDNGHGTHLAGIVAGVQNNIGITGVAHNATIMPVKILDRDGLGTFNDIVEGIRYAADNGADVINLSLGVDFSQSSLSNAIKYAYDKGVVVVSAAGNGGENRPLFPAMYADRYGLAVGAVDSSNHYQSYSNRSGSNSLDYIVAPGHRISSTAPASGVQSKSGTSQSTAHVSGIAALIRSAKPGLSANKVEDLIVKTASSQRVQL